MYVLTYFILHHVDYLTQFIGSTLQMPGPEDTILAVAGLLAAFKGAVDGFLLIESMFEKQRGL